MTPMTSNSSTTTDPAGSSERLCRVDALAALEASSATFAEEPDHPGVVLNKEFLVPLGLTTYWLSKASGMSQTRLGEILRGERGITPDAAVRLAVVFGTSAEFWTGLQADYALRSFLATEGRQVVKRVRDLSARLPLREPAPPASEPRPGRIRRKLATARMSRQATRHSSTTYQPPSRATSTNVQYQASDPPT